MSEKQHYLPKQAYLKEFTLASKVHMYTVAESKLNFYKSTPIHTTPSKVARVNDLYEVPDIDKGAVERMLTAIENDYQEVYQEKILNNIVLTDEDISKVSRFVATFEMRTPKSLGFAKDQLLQMKKMGKQMAKVNSASSSELESEIDAAIAALPAINLSAAVEVNRWQYSDMCVLNIPKSLSDSGAYFITSDNPTSFINFTSMNTIYGLAPYSATAELVLPLSSKKALFINNVGISGYKDLGINLIGEINRRTVEATKSYIFSPTIIDRDTYDYMRKRYPQSLILTYIELPTGRMEKLAAQFKKKKKIG